MKHCLRIGAVVIIFILICCGCGRLPGASDKVDNHLWIVTNDGGMKRVIDRVSEQFLEDHPGLTITVDTGPDDADEWPLYLERLRTEIMAGEGPDIFLFLSENISSSSLVTDVNQFMHNGLFLDITEYYDQDTALNKDALVCPVMDAGVVDGARYVLPLRYNFPVIYADVGQLEAAGVSVDDLKNGLPGLVAAAERMGEGSLSADYGSFYFYFYWMNFLPELIDYENQNVSLDKEELVEFLAEYRALMACGIIGSVPGFDSYRDSEAFWALDGHGLYLGNLNRLLENVWIAKEAGMELEMIPLTCSDGSLIANVSYYGAVGANTDSPELAYAFLREMLKAENQWENADEVLTNSLIDQGFPVSTEGLQTEFDWILDTRIDAVRFFPAEQFDYMTVIDSRLNINSNPNAMEEDLEALAEEIIQELEWHLAEG